MGSEKPGEPSVPAEQWRGLLGPLVLALGLGACGEEAGTAKSGGGDPSRGRQIYLTQCIACHHPDPSREGPLGPPVKGASRELLEARIVRGSYPPGYTPKRQSAIMQPMPRLASAIPDLEAFLK